jgi:predicted DNA-binding ribbon-helix-helix protein
MDQRYSDDTNPETCSSSQYSPFICRSHSLRLRGSVTSIRLEKAFWDILAEIAKQEAITVNKLIARICLLADADFIPQHNHASVLRVTCVMYLAGKLLDPPPASTLTRLSIYEAGRESAGSAPD